MWSSADNDIGDVANSHRICSNCEKAGVPCEGGGQSGFRIRFVDVGSKKRKRRRSAPPGTTSVLETLGQSTGRHNESPSGLVFSGSDENHAENPDSHLPTYTSETEDNPNPIHSACPTPLNDDGATVAKLSDRRVLQLSSSNETSLDHPLDTFPEVAASVNHEDISTPCIASNASPVHPFPETRVHRMVPMTWTGDLKPPCLWPLAEREVQLVKHFFAVLVSWVRNRVVMPKFSI